jgi:formate/nitrite transporter FocA (FNT family)
LERPLSSLIATGLVGGLDVGIGVMALLMVEARTGNRLLGALAFGIGFLALTLANSELFTENFLVPIMAVVAKDAKWPAVARLWEQRREKPAGGETVARNGDEDADVPPERG